MIPTVTAMDFEEVRRLLPQKYPFIFIDRVQEIEPGRRIICLKNVTGNEPYFKGHFPDFAVMPGALILEALGQAAILLFQKSSVEQTGRVRRFVFTTVKGRMLKPVLPGDQMRLEVTMEKMISTGGIVKGEATVEGQVCVRSELTFAAVDEGTTFPESPAS